jgi:hypothetical protein
VASTVDVSLPLGSGTVPGFSYQLLTSHNWFNQPLKSKPKLCYDRRSVGQTILVLSTHLGPKTRFSLLSASCGFVDVERPLSWEDGFIVYISAGPRQRSHSLVPVPQHSLYHILLSQILDSPNLEDQVPAFISCSKRVAQLYPHALGSLFVASYESQGYGGGTRIRLHLNY